jgi:transcriptional regulator with XRE-family HTH domain
VRINPEALRVIRRDREVRLVDLAKAVECTPSHLTNVEAGRREASARLIRALARELRVPLLSLLGPEVRPDEAPPAQDTGAEPRDAHPDRTAR